MELIKHKDPQSKKRKVRLFVVTATIFFVGAIITGGWEGVKFIFPISLIILTVYVIVLNIEKQYDGWNITTEGIELIRIDLLKGKESIFIKNEQIKSIKYIQPQYQVPLTFIFYSSQGRKILIPRVEVFKLAPMLKYFYDKSIRIEYSVSDYEVDLYIKGKIDVLPMTNDMKIKN